MTWEKPQLDSITFRFVQDGNTTGTTSEIETLIVSCETQMPGEDCFLLFRTDGWSMNDSNELKELVTKCESAFKIVSGKKVVSRELVVQ